MAALIPKVNATAGSATAPGAGALVTGELAENKFTGRLYVKTESNAVVDPARVTLTGDVTGSTATATSEAQGGTIATVLSTVGVGKGGTGLTATPTAGQIPIGNGTGYTLAQLTAGSNVTITNGGGTITIASTASGSSGGSGGIKIFDTVGANQSWTVPAGVASVRIHVIGAGAGETGNGGSTTCSVGGTAVTATGGVTNGAGGSVAAVAGVGLGAGTGGVYGNNTNGYVGGRGTGSSGGYGGGGGAVSNQGNFAGGGAGMGGGGVAQIVYSIDGCSSPMVVIPGQGCGYGGGGLSQSSAPSSSGFGGGYNGGGGGYAVYMVAVTAGATYTNAITVGAGGTGSSAPVQGRQGAVIIEW